MLIIRKAQMDALAEGALDPFREWMVRHLRKHFGIQLAPKGDEELLAFVRTGIARAKGHGVDDAVSCCKFIDLMVVFGEDFDSEIPWAVHALRNEALPDARARVAALSIVALDHVED